jgi:hypothetical protein
MAHCRLFYHEFLPAALDLPLFLLCTGLGSPRPTPAGVAELVLDPVGRTFRCAVSSLCALIFCTMANMVRYHSIQSEHGIFANRLHDRACLPPSPSSCNGPDLPAPSKRRTPWAQLLRRVLEAGSFHTCALLGAGGGMRWGSSMYGQLGEPASGPTLTPVDIIL